MSVEKIFNDYKVTSTKDVSDSNIKVEHNIGKPKYFKIISEKDETSQIKIIFNDEKITITAPTDTSTQVVYALISKVFDLDIEKINLYIGGINQHLKVPNSTLGSLHFDHLILSIDLEFDQYLFLRKNQKYNIYEKNDQDHLEGLLSVFIEFYHNNDIVCYNLDQNSIFLEKDGDIFFKASKITIERANKDDTIFNSSIYLFVRQMFPSLSNTKLFQNMLLVPITNWDHAVSFLKQCSEKLYGCDAKNKIKFARKSRGTIITNVIKHLYENTDDWKTKSKMERNTDIGAIFGIDAEKVSGYTNAHEQPMRPPSMPKVRNIEQEPKVRDIEQEIRIKEQELEQLRQELEEQNSRKRKLQQIEQEHEEQLEILEQEYQEKKRKIEQEYQEKKSKV